MTRLRSLTLQMWRAHRPLAIFAIGNVALALFSLIAMAVDQRILGGMPIWTKPFKFAMSFLLYTVMWMWLISRVRGWTPTTRLMGTVVAVMGVVELAAIVLQVFRGRQSHFNQLTTFDSMVWLVMAVGIIVLFLANMVWSVLLWRQRDTDASVALAVRLGIILSAVGLALGGLMAYPRPDQLEAEDAGIPSLSGAHAIGIADGGAGIPLLGWSTEGGDLRIGHFVGMHALQLMPLLALGLILLAPRVPVLRDEISRARLVLVIGVAYAAVIALVTWQALRGQPIIAPDALTLGAFGAIVVGSTLAATRILTRAPDREAVQTV